METRANEGDLNRRGRRHAVGSGVEAGDRQWCVVGHDAMWGGELDTWGPVGCTVVESDATWGAESDMQGPVGCAVVESRHRLW